MSAKIVIEDGTTAAPAPFPPPELKAAEKKEKVLRPSAVPITDVTLIIGMKTKDGKREEVIHDINTDDALRIVTCSHTIEEKTRACKEDGQLVGYEPTGEYVLTLKVKYIKD